MHIHEAPTGLVDHCAAPAVMVNAQPAIKRGSRDQGDVGDLITWLADKDQFVDYSNWLTLGMALRAEFGEDGRELWRLAHDSSVTAHAEESKWASFKTEARPGQFTLATVMKNAHALGWKGRVRPDTAQMFGGVASATIDTRTSLIGGSSASPQIAPPEYSEIEIASRFSNEYATQIRYVKTRGQWLHWNGKRWLVDDRDYVSDLVRQHCRFEAGLCAGTPGQTPAQARSINSNRTVTAVLNLSRVDQRIASTVADWDQDPWLLGTPDGIVDLRSGTIRQAKPEDCVTKCTAVSPGGDCPVWLTFLRRATNGDEHMQSYLQRMAGYFLTGSTQEQTLHFVYGPGRSGKGTFMNPIAKILRDYHVTTAIETLTESKSDRHPTEVAALQGARLVTCSETERGRHWAESRIKQFTGGDQITARFMNQNFFSFTPTFKLLISGNYKPHLRPDSAMRRRFQLIPFEVAIPESEQDPRLAHKLEAEWPGILAWMVQGAVAWQGSGLAAPKCVVTATESYMNDEADDIVSQWLADCCVEAPSAECPNHALYGSYRAFAERAGEKPMTSISLGKELARRGCGERRTSVTRYRVGIMLKPPPFIPRQQESVL